MRRDNYNQIGNQEFEMAFGNSWWWRVRHDGLKQGLHVDPFVRHLMHGIQPWHWHKPRESPTARPLH